MVRSMVDEHSPAPDEVMAYLDGELTPDRAAAVDEHLRGCESCQQLRDELRRTSRELALWKAGTVPSTLKPPAFPEAAAPQMPSRRVWWRRRALVWQLAGGAALAGLAAILVFGPSAKRPPSVSAVSFEPERRTATATASAASQPHPTRAAAERTIVAGQPAESPERPARARAPMIARTARLRITAADFDAVRPALDRIVANVGGYLGQIEASGSRGESRSLTATVRVPAGRLNDALAALKALGQVDEESQTGDDVTEQMIDIAARLTNARATEKRLRDLLTNRTGDVADVLSVEREIMRVREEIERLDAQRQHLETRVAYATVALHVGEQRKAALDLGPLPISTRFRNALVDGWTDALESGLAAALFVLRIAPVLLLWGIVLVWPAWVISRKLSLARTPGGSRGER